MGPLLLLVCINDMSLCVHFSTVFMLADDAKCSSHITTNLEDCHLLQQDLDNNCMSNLQPLTFNASKCSHAVYLALTQIDGNILYQQLIIIIT